MPLPAAGRCGAGAGARQKGWSDCRCQGRVPSGGPGGRAREPEKVGAGQGLGDRPLQPPSSTDEKPGGPEKVWAK